MLIFVPKKLSVKKKVDRTILWVKGIAIHVPVL
jgi:hypothetical protein